METPASDNALPHLTAFEARILGCLIEKKELTPDVYPMSLNGLATAANQKTSREPVMEMDPGQVRHALTGLQKKGLARQGFASRVERYEHLMAQHFSLTRGQIAILGLLMLRGPQTAYELLARSERMANFSGVDALREELDMLIGRRLPLVKEIGRAPGQREDRYAHLLSGDVAAAPAVRPVLADSSHEAAGGDLVRRVAALEEQVSALIARLDDLGG